MSRVVVGMSGGVDSAVTAYLLKASGYDVIGVTLRTWINAKDEVSRCCEIDDAKAAADSLGIPYYVHNAGEAFRTYVTTPFIEEYLAGRTPNPCVVCNRYVKWEGMLQAADIFGAEYVATGHYASVVRLPNGRFTIRQAANVAKDQTYMVYRLTQEQLARTILPLGNLTKEEVRVIAQKAGLMVADKPDSQEICFVSEGHYADYIETHSEKEVPGEGNFVDEDGNVLGKHKGITHYTVGQRKGLGIALGHPVFVLKICPETNEVVLGEEEVLFTTDVVCDDLNYMSVEAIKTGEEIPARVRIRYHHAGEEAVLTRLDADRIRIRFAKPVRAATPGQSAVFYDSDGCVIGGGRIL